MIKTLESSNRSDVTQDLGLYIHWPFCASKCPYCDFNSHVNEAVDQDLWRTALLKELESVGTQTQNGPTNRVLKSVFFGGGTPSLMPPQTVQSLIDALPLYFHLSPDLEITLEGNPNSIDVDKYKAFKTAGINRVSVGIQSLRENSLKFLGRLHDINEAKRALDVTRSLFDKSSFDLIYALPGQTLFSWESELSEALSFAQGHLSLYQLIIEPGTAFYTRYHRGEFKLPTDDESADLFTLTRDIMSSNGFDLYEVSNFAKPGHECQHNLIYWQYDDYACIGPGAHGRLTLDQKKYAIRNHRAPDIWLDHVRQHGHGEKVRDALSSKDQILEHIMMNLRLSAGISKSDFLQKHQLSLESLFSQMTVDNLVAAGYIKSDSAYFKVTNEGMLRLDAIIKTLVTSSKLLTP